ncbi:GH25 family lysozyme [Saccharopolyspora sp. SCSIO 74807]|uniref:GH25 family lysozyme n=1 Tax=Saccharopolyspora sp. SCSIO 74807 TaxID=3118084 RepID=UPI0030D2932B
MTPPDQHTNPEDGRGPSTPTPDQPQNQDVSADNSWRASALRADNAVRSGVDRVRPHAHRAWQRVLPLLRRIWLALLPLVKRVQGTAAWQRAEQRVRPLARDLSGRVRSATSESTAGQHRKQHPRLRALQAGGVVAAVGVLGVALVSIGTGSSSDDVRTAAHVDDMPSAGQQKSQADGSGGGLFGGDDSEEPPGPVPGPPAHGIDVSNHNGPIDWKRVAGAGQNFAFVLSTDGTDFASPKFDQQYHGAKDAGMIAGAYHFARPDESAEAQADKMLSVIDYKKDGKTLPPVLDLEPNSSGSKCYGLSPDQMHQWTQKFNDRIKAATGTDVIVYANPSFWKQCAGGTDKFADHPLWVASYGVDQPTPPAGFHNWNFWQYTDKGKVDGVQGKVDLDHFNGSVGDLQNLAEQ